MNRKFSDLVFILLALVILLIPVFGMNLRPDQTSVTENRKLAEFPTPAAGVSAFMRGIDSYVDDRIGFRDGIMRLYSQWNYAVLDGNHSSVISGKDGWLFYREELADYTGTNIDPAKTAKQARILSAIDRWCKERGITFVVAVGPNKSSVYDRFMPDSVYHAPVSNLDMLTQALSDTGIRFLCPKDALIANRDQQELYMRQDTHWNSYGGRYLLDALVGELGLPPYTGRVTEDRRSEGDLLTMLGLGPNEYTSLYVEPFLKEGASVEYVNELDLILHAPDNASFVCYRDSYTLAMVAYYTHYFRGPMYWRYDIDFDLVDRTRPQYLIFSCVERYLDEAIAANEDILNRIA